MLKTELNNTSPLLDCPWLGARVPLLHYLLGDRKMIVHDPARLFRWCHGAMQKKETRGVDYAKFPSPPNSPFSQALHLRGEVSEGTERRKKLEEWEINVLLPSFSA